MGIHWQSILSRVRAGLMRRGQTRQDADDLVQEAWLRFASYERKHAVAEPEALSDACCVEPVHRCLPSQ